MRHKYLVWDGERLLRPTEAAARGYTITPDGLSMKGREVGGEWFQETGFIDPNGQWIHDGHLVRLKSQDWGGGIWEVLWGSQSRSWMLRQGADVEPMKLWWYFMHVVGHKRTHPELAEEVRNGG